MVKLAAFAICLLSCGLLSAADLSGRVRPAHPGLRRSASVFLLDHLTRREPAPAVQRLAELQFREPGLILADEWDLLTVSRDMEVRSRAIRSRGGPELERAIGSAKSEVLRESPAALEADTGRVQRLTARIEEILDQLLPRSVVAADDGDRHGFISWNDSRTTDQYNEHLALKIEDRMAQGGTWIDAGAGRGSALRPFIGLPGARLVAVNGTSQKGTYHVDGVENFNLMLPQDRQVHDHLRGSAGLVTDVYGPASYAADPLQVLLYEASLLAAGGLLAVSTELDRFSRTSWPRIASFLRDFSGQDARFDVVKTDRGVIERSRILVSGRGGFELSAAFEAAQRAIGLPRRGRLLWENGTGSAQIWRADYRRTR